VQYKRYEQTHTALSSAVGSKPKQFPVNELAKIVDGKPEGNRPAGKLGLRERNNFEADFKGICCEGWTGLTLYTPN
jgi:hypothetical protein